MTTRAGKLRIIAVAIQLYQVMKAQSELLPDHYFPLGWTEETLFSSVEFFDGYVQVRCNTCEHMDLPSKAITISSRRCWYAPTHALSSTFVSCRSASSIHSYGQSGASLLWQQSMKQSKTLHT